MINNGYLAVDSEKTIFKKTTGSDYIIHGLFVDDMMHISSCDEHKTSMVAIAGETDRDLAATKFTKTALHTIL
jgi:hypothetical protein